jgi:hypothetical protein
MIFGLAVAALSIFWCSARMSASSHAVAWVSASLEKFVDPDAGCARSFKSKRNKPLLVRFKGKLLEIFVACNTCLVVSIVAPNALSKVFDRRNGVAPGTTAILSKSPWIGTTMACWLCKIP